MDDPLDPGATRILYANTAASEAAQTDLGQLLGRTIRDAAPDLLKTTIPEGLAEIARTGRARDLGEIDYGDDNIRWGTYAIYAYPIRGNEVAVAYQNVTDQRLAERQFRVSIEASPVSVLIVDPSGAIVFANDPSEALFGYRRSELIGRPVETLIPERFRGAHRKHREEFVASPSVRRMGVRPRLIGRRKDGSEFACELMLAPIRWDQGLHVFTAITDLSDSKRLEEVFEQAAVGMSHLSPEGVFLRVSESFARFLMYEPQQLVGLRISDVSVPDEDSGDSEWLSRIVSARAPLTREKRYVRSDGAVVWGETACSPILNDDGVVAYLSIITTDVTERRSLEAQLESARRLEAIGRLAGAVAHDFNNMLTVISSYTSLLSGQFGEDDPARDDLEAIAAATERAARLTDQLLAFSRRRPQMLEVVDLNGVVAGIAGMLKRLVGEDVELVTELQPGLGFVRVDRDQIEQVLMNLAANAHDAMPDGGSLEIETANATLESAHTDPRGEEVPAGSYVVIRVSDTGQGMDATTRAQAFEPFFSTKGAAGTGLGLATAYGAVKQSEGYIWLDSEPGRGTTFQIFLPRAPTDAAAAREVLDPPSDPRGSETILLVEDETTLREGLSRILVAAGYGVLTAASGADAVSVFERHPDRVDLVLTDVVMPGMSARDLSRRLREIRADVGVLYMSGYAGPEAARRAVVKDDAWFLSKPFTSERLLQKVRQALDHDERGSRNGS